MNNRKRKLAIIGIIFLLALFASSLIFAFIDTTSSLILLKTSIAASLFFPVMIYVALLISKMGNDNNYTEDEEEIED